MLNVLLDDNYKKSEVCKDGFDVFQTFIKPKNLK